jgi:hypothetical protein
MVTVTAIRKPNKADFEVSIISLDPHMKIVFDESALKTMNEKISEKAAQFEARDPRAKTYIEEYVSRMLPELQRVHLLEFQEIKDEPEDPYKFIRESFKGN